MISQSNQSQDNKANGLLKIDSIQSPLKKPQRYRGPFLEKDPVTQKSIDRLLRTLQSRTYKENLPIKLQTPTSIIDSFGQINIPFYIVAPWGTISQFSSQDGHSTSTFYWVQSDIPSTFSELVSTPLEMPYLNNVSEDKVIDVNHIPPLSPRQLSNLSQLSFQPRESSQHLPTR